MHIRDDIINVVRHYLKRGKYQEITVPIFNNAVPLEPNIYPFELKGKYLSTSPERCLKIQLAKERRNYYAIGHCFREFEIEGPLHKQEFLMLEWYRWNVNYVYIMNELEKLLISVFKSLKKTNTLPIHLFSIWKTVSLKTLFETYATSDYENLVKDTTKDEEDWRGSFDQLFVNKIEPHLKNGNYFITDFPTRISPFCKVQNGKEYLAERFELYMNGVEIANGNTESTDYNHIRGVFENEIQKRKSGVVDEEFLSALRKMDGTLFAGVGVGIERLVMVLTGAQNINEIL